MEQETKRTINANGRLFRYAYWFTPKYSRPAHGERLNLCPFFWRVLFITLVAMPLYWIVWVPVGFCIGIFFGTRPRVFGSDGVGDWSEPLEPYQHWWPKVDGENRALPIIVLAVSAFTVLLVVLSMAAHSVSLYGHTLLTWLIGTSFVVLGGWLLLSRAWESETWRLAKDALAERKKGICPIYEVIYTKK